MKTSPGRFFGWLWREWLRPFALAAAIVFPLKSAVADWNDVRQTNAVKRHRVYVFDQSFAYVPGTRYLQFVRALAYDEQFFKLVESENNRVRLSIGQNISGVFAPRTPGELSRISQSLNLLNQAIKKRAEAMNASIS